LALHILDKFHLSLINYQLSIINQLL